MKVLWLVNLILPAFAASQGLPYSEREGWLTGLYGAVKACSAGGQEAADINTPEITLAVAYPTSSESMSGAQEFSRTEWDGTVWYGFCEDLAHPEIYEEGMEEAFRKILADFQPDIVHVFGTEFPHALACLKAFSRPERSLVGIQGLCCGIAENYMAGLPNKVQREATFRDRVRSDSLRRQQEKFRRRAEHERELLALAGHVTGRTAYDERVTGELNPDRIYHPMNETLRGEFYEGVWDPGKAVKHRIFLPQGDYPLKGFHHLLAAAGELLADYPDLEIRVAGISVIGGDRKRVPLLLRIGAYGRYLKRLIAEGSLRKKVTILGKLSASRMKEEMLEAGVFVLPSVIENSPNSMGEAMLLGLPVVASRTGGIPSLLADGREGLLVEPGDAKALADAIRQIWEEPVIAAVYGENARKRALVTHDPEINQRRLLEIYEEIERS